MVARLYRSTDVGAPQLGTTNDGSLMNILRACLVDGYGSGQYTRTPAGWTIPFSDFDNKVAVFKNASGEHIRLDDSLDYRWASVRCFKNMYDIDNGVEEYPYSNDGYHSRVFKRYSSSSGYERWFVVATDEYFYFVGIHYSSSPSYPAGFFFGKYECLNPSFTENHLVTTHQTLTSDASATNSFKSLYATVSVSARRNYQNGQIPTYLGYRFESNAYANPNPFTGSLELEKVRLINGAVAINYGFMPDMFRVMGNTNMGYYGGETFAQGADNYIVAAYTSSAYAIRFDELDG